MTIEILRNGHSTKSISRDARRFDMHQEQALPVAGGGYLPMRA
jgi:hypothetical protein